MTDIEQPAEDPVSPEEEAPAPEPEPALETAETPAEEPETAVEAPPAATRMTWVDGDGNEFFYGPGETIPDGAVPA